MLRKTGNPYLWKGALSPVMALLTLSALLSGVLNAQGSPVRAYLDKTRVRLGERFVLSVEISGEAARDYEEPSLPEMSDFARFQGSGSSQQLQIINGRASSSYKIDFYFTAIREGDFEIGPVKVESRGRMYPTQPIHLSIGPSPTAGGDPLAATRPRNRELFVVATPHQKTAFQNEAVVITYKIYTRLSVSSFSIGKLPETAGFWVENYTLPQSPSTRTEIISGRRYTVATIKKMAVFPTTAGKKKIGPLQIKCQVRVQRRTRSLFDDFFSRDLFGSSETLSVASNPVELEILPLPEEERPPGFNGAVGRFGISTQVINESSRANQAFSLRVKIEGEGNIQQLAEPQLELPESFEVYPPEIEQELRHGVLGLSGQKTYEYVAIPRRAGSFSLKPIEISYFDPRDRTYKTARSEPLTLEIAPGDDSLAVDTASLTKRELQLVGQDIRFIKTSGDKLSRRSSQPGTGFWSLLVVPLVALAGARVLRQHRLRLQNDVAWARARQAAGAARKRLSRARRSLEGESAGFYGEVDRALAGFIANKLNLPDPSLISHEVRHMLLAAGVSAELVNEALDCRDICDRNRFFTSQHLPREKGGVPGPRGALSDSTREPAGKAAKLMVGLFRRGGKRAAGAALMMSLLPLVNTHCSVDETRQEALRRFQEANQNYSEGKFDEALKTYLEVAETGFASGPLFYNIGNCYYRQSKIGKSILFYERARLFMPGDEDLAHNLELSQLKVIDKIGAMPEFWLIRLWRGSVHLMSPALLSLLLTLSWLGFVASLIVRLLGDSAWTRWSAPAAKVCLLVLLISATCLGSQWWTRANTTRAIVTAESVRAFGSPGGGGVEVFVLHKGVKVGIDEIRDGWYEIVLADGNHGWVRTDGVEII